MKGRNLILLGCLIFSNIISANEILLKDKAEIASAQELNQERIKVSKIITPCIDKVGDHFTCLCKHKEIVLKFNKLIDDKLNRHPSWLQYKTIKFTDARHQTSKLDVRSMVNQIKEPLYCNGNVADNYSDTALTMRNARKQIDNRNKYSKEAIDYIAKNYKRAEPSLLFRASNSAYKHKDFVSAGFLYYSGRLKIAQDSICYIPDEDSRKKALNILGVFRVTLGSWIDKNLKRLPDEKRNIVSRLKEINMGYSVGYKPEWKYSKRLEWNSCKPKMDKLKNDLIEKVSAL